MKGRREIAHQYPEYQLWYLMLVLLKVAAYFEEQESFLGNVHTSNVFLDEKGRVKLFTVFSAPREQENAQKIRTSKYEDAFIGKSFVMQRLSNCPFWIRCKGREEMWIKGEWTSAVWICSISGLAYSLPLC